MGGGRQEAGDESLESGGERREAGAINGLSTLKNRTFWYSTNSPLLFAEKMLRA